MPARTHLSTGSPGADAYLAALLASDVEVVAVSIADYNGCTWILSEVHGGGKTENLDPVFAAELTGYNAAHAAGEPLIYRILDVDDPNDGLWGDRPRSWLGIPAA